ncbi:MAG TPA: transposase [Woeseiaceae bacterium]|nr:transposase [Woeseiaceae bacterium]
MPRANRVYCRGAVWHLTHRCHQRAFLLRFARDRRRWRHWLFEARRRYGLCVLNYIVTSNHIHLLVADRGEREIAASMRLIASQTAQEYNRRKGRNGAFWEDRYHATAVQTGDHLIRCLSYIDLNMVRAGAVRHPAEWNDSGFHEIQKPPPRKRIIDHERLGELVEIRDFEALRIAHLSWVNEALDRPQRQPIWTESVAVGDEHFLCRFKQDLGIGARYRRIRRAGNLTCLHEAGSSYRPFSAPKTCD